MNSVDVLNDANKIEKTERKWRGIDMAKPIKKYRSTKVEAAMWENDREVNGNIVFFKTVELKKELA